MNAKSMSELAALGLLFLMLIVTAGCAPSRQQLIERVNKIRQEYVDKNPELAISTKNAVLGGVVTPGMTIEQVVATMGALPGGTYVHTSFSDGVTRECFVFGPELICFRNEKAYEHCRDTSPRHLLTVHLECSPLPYDVGYKLVDYMY